MLGDLFGFLGHFSNYWLGWWDYQLSNKKIVARYRYLFTFGDFRPISLEKTGKSAILSPPVRMHVGSYASLSVCLSV